MMAIESIALFSFTLNLDIFLVSFMIGTNISRAKIIPVMALTVAFVLSLMPLFGYGIGQLLGSLLGTNSHFIGAAILFFVGMLVIREAYLRKGPMNTTNLLLIYLGVSMEELMAGLSFGMQSGSIFMFILMFFCISALMNGVAFSLGKMVRRYLNFSVGYITGGILIAMGLWSLFGIG